MTNERAVPSPTSFLLLLVQAFPLLRLPPAHHSCTRGYLLGTTSNLGGGGGGGGGGKGGGGLHWQICWQLSVTFSSTGLEHDFWGSPRAICEETGHCMSSRSSENWFSMNVFLGLEYPSSTSNLYSELSWSSSVEPLQGGLFPTRSPFLVFLLNTVSSRPLSLRQIWLKLASWFLNYYGIRRKRVVADNMIA